MANSSCEVCRENNHKYKCPKCSTKYCSLACFKTHKRDCEQLQQAYEKPSAAAVTDRPPVEPQFQRDFRDGDENEDIVSADKLALLSQCEDVKQKLQNPHLRQVLLDIDQGKTDKAVLMEVAMRDPIFSEFATACLGCVEK